MTIKLINTSTEANNLEHFQKTLPTGCEYAIFMLQMRVFKNNILQEFRFVC